MNNREPAYPALDRTAFLIERACVPKYIPSYHAEAAQVLAEIERRLSQQPQPGGDTNVSG